MKELTNSCVVYPILGTISLVKWVLIAASWIIRASLLPWIFAGKLEDKIKDTQNEGAGYTMAFVWSIALVIANLIAMFHYNDADARIFNYNGYQGWEHILLILGFSNIFSFLSEIGREINENSAKEKEGAKKAEAPKPPPEPVKPPDPQPDQKSSCDIMMDKIQAVEFPTEAQARELSNEVLNLVADGKVSKNDGQRLSKMIQNARENAVENEPTT